MVAPRYVGTKYGSVAVQGDGALLHLCANARDRLGSYPTELSPTESEILKTLHETERSAFRICRDLALRDAQLIFFLAGDHLARRLAHPREVNGWRLLGSFVNLGIISLVERGHVRTKGQQSLASSYRWELPLFRQSAAAA